MGEPRRSLGARASIRFASSCGARSQAVQAALESRYALVVSAGAPFLGAEPGADQGTAADPVIIHSGVAEPSLGDWIGFIFEAGGDEGTELSHTTISNAVTGIHLKQRDAQIEHCTISDCESYGIFCDDYSAPKISDCVIRNNYFVGVRCRYNSSPTIQRCYISGGAGYGIQAEERSQPTITNCVITGVVTTGIRLENLSNATIINNTVAYNGYFGVFCRKNTSPEIRNCIFYKNGTELRGGTGIIAEYTSLPVIDYNCFWDHPTHAVDISGNTTLTGYNIEEDPDFVDAESGDFHLRDGSPCLTSGDPDIDLQMGAYGGPDAGD